MFRKMQTISLKFSNVKEYVYIRPYTCLIIQIYIYAQNKIVMLLSKKKQNNNEHNDSNKLETEKCIKTGDYVEIISDLMSN